MKRREFIKRSSAAVAGGLLASGLAESAGRHNADKPNILMITCHDIGQHLGCYGVRTVRTDNIDRLAEKGIRFANYYSTSAVCSPGRGSLHTGRYPQSNGLLGLTHAPWWWRLNDGERHTAAILKEAGYETYLIGFCHVGSPPALGYERHLSPRSRAQETALAAQGLIKARKPADRPFFAKVGFTEVHRPFTHGSDTERGLFVPPWLQSTRQVRDDLAQFQAEIKFFDGQVGRILDALEKSRIADNTVVIFTSDHGIPYPGAKWSARKAGIEIPMIIYQPNSTLSGGRVFTEPASHVDALPTLLDFLDIPIPPGVEGVSFRPLIEGTSNRPPRRAVFGQFTPAMKRDNLSRCIISGRYQLIRYFEAGRAVDYPVDVHPQLFAAHRRRCQTKGGARPFFQLYDIQEDPYELNDLGSQKKYAPIVRNLSDRLLSWMKEVNDPLLRGPTRTPYYERAMKDFLEM